MSLRRHVRLLPEQQQSCSHIHKTCSPAIYALEEPEKQQEHTHTDAKKVSAHAQEDIMALCATSGRPKPRPKFLAAAGRPDSVEIATEALF